MSGNTRNRFAIGIALGIAIGASLGVAFRNIPVWTGLGVAIGVALGFLMSRASRS